MAFVDDIQPKGLIHAAPLTGRTVKFTEGQVVTGKVLNITEQGAVISIAGVKILAKPLSSALLQEGAIIKVRIEVVSDEKVALRLLEQRTDQLFSLKPLEDSDIEQILLKAGMPTDVKSFTAARALISAGVSANSANLETLFNLMQKLRLDGFADAKILAFLIGRNIPITQEAIVLIKELFSNAKLGQLLNQLQQDLPQLPDTVSRQLLSSINKLTSLLKLNSPADIQATLKEMLQNISFDRHLLTGAKTTTNSTELNNIAIESLKSGQNILSSIDRPSLKQIGLSLNTVKQANELITGILKNSDSNIDLAFTQKLLGILPEIISKLSKISSSESAKLSNILFKLSLFVRLQTTDEAGQNILNELRSSFFDVQQAIKSVGPGNNAANRINELLARINTNINAQQLISNSSDLSQAPLNIMYMQLPFKLQNEVHTLEIAVQGDASKAKKIDPNNTSITFLLTLPNMGEIIISTTIEDGNITGRFMVENNAAKEAIDNSKYELEDNLSALARGDVIFTSEIKEPTAAMPTVEETLIPIELHKMDIYA